MFDVFAICSAASILLLLFCGWLTSLMPVYWLACGMGLLWFFVMWFDLWRN